MCYTTNPDSGMFKLLFISRFARVVQLECKRQAAKLQKSSKQ